MVGAFPDGKSALMFVTARLKYVAVSEWGSKRYLDVTLLDERPHRMAGLWGCRKVRKDLDGASPVTPLSGFAVRLIWRADRFLWFSALLDVRPLQLVAWMRACEAIFTPASLPLGCPFAGWASIGSRSP